jgi:hypothetical protein
MTSIYIASKVKHAAKWKALRDQGYNIISTWIDEAGEGETKDKRDLASRCIRESIESNRFIVYAEEGDILVGAYIEIGAAIAWSIPIYAVGLVLKEKSAFRHHYLWHQCDSLEEALKDTK